MVERYNWEVDRVSCDNTQRGNKQFGKLFICILLRNKHSCLWDGAVDFDLFVVEQSVNHEPACKPAPLEKFIRQILNHMPGSNIGSLSIFCVRLRKRPAHQ